MIEKDAKYGWTIGTLNDEATEWVAAIFDGEGLAVSRMPEAPIGKAGRKASVNRSRKYACPCCGTSVRATKDVHVICGDCDEQMQLIS